MAKTSSKMVALKTKAPDFFLPDHNNVKHSLNDFSDSKAYLIMFICNHCPYVVHIRDAMVGLANDFKKKQIAVIAINSNDIEEYPEDNLENMKRYAEQYNYNFPYLYDESQNVARAYGAVCTPDFFLFDSKRELFYRGQFDDSRPGKAIDVTGKDLRSAAESLLTGSEFHNQKPSLGCNIKWKKNVK